MVAPPTPSSRGSPDKAGGSKILDSRRVGPVAGYVAATAITVGVIVSQYVIPETFPETASVYGNLGSDILIVYGIPIVAFLLLVGLGPLRGWRGSMRTSVVQGISWYGVLSLVALFVAFVLIAVLAEVEPGLLPLLSRPNPALSAAASDPWFFIAFSFAVGAFEETIFRGWIFGYWLARGTPRWLFHALWTSVLFASVHLYYGTTYGAASVVLFPTLFLTGLAFAITVRNSNGNLVTVSLLHGWSDATAFVSLISVGASLLLHYGTILVGVVVFIALWVRSHSATPPTVGAGGTTPTPPPPTSLEVGTPLPADGGSESAPEATGARV